MNPLAINPWALLGAGALALTLGFGAGWQVQGWRLRADIAEVKLDNATAITQASQVALDDYKRAASAIKDAATGAQVDTIAILGQLAAIKRNYANAKPAPLPPDCRPGPDRLRYLSETTAAANAAIARPVPGK
nr:hypothetical protein [uncultured Duganella sp.]